MGSGNAHRSMMLRRQFASFHFSRPRPDCSNVCCAGTSRGVRFCFIIVDLGTLGGDVSQATSLNDSDVWRRVQ